MNGSRVTQQAAAPSLSDRLAKAAEERPDGEYGAIWRKDEQPQIEGRVIRVDERDDKDKPDEEPFSVIEIEDRDGTRTSIFANATVLRKEVERVGPRVGDWLAVGYLGLQPGRDGGNSWGDYVVILDRPDGERPVAGDEATEVARQEERDELDAVLRD